MKILLLVQAPCTAGTFITKYLCNRLNPDCLVAETNPWWISNLDVSSFAPQFPATLPTLMGCYTHSEALQIFAAGVNELLRIAAAKGFELIIIRDHLFSEYFLAVQNGHKNQISSPFWVNYLEDAGIDYRIVFSIRHPFDSYLGLCYSFPKLASSFSLESYSKFYFNAVQNFNRIRGISFLSIESLAAQKNNHPLLGELSDWARSKQKFASDYSELRMWNSSGASGRSFKDPIKFKRRRYGSCLRKQALHSNALQMLCNELGYLHETDAFESKSEIMSSLISDFIFWCYNLPFLASLLSRLKIERPATQPSP